MNALTSQQAEVERATRQIALALSVVVAVGLAICFAADLARGFELRDEAISFTALVVLAMGCYAVAWRRGWELGAATVAIMSIFAAFVVAEVPQLSWTMWGMLGIATPAVLHLVACALRRGIVPTRRTQRAA